MEECDTVRSLILCPKDFGHGSGQGLTSYVCTIIEEVKLTLKLFVLE